MFTTCPVCNRIVVTNENLRKLRNIIIGVVGTSVLAVLALPLIGFGAGGVRAGSIAAAWQSRIGNVPADSLFSSLQRLGATGVSRIIFSNPDTAMEYLVTLSRYLDWCNDPEHQRAE